ncbi:hypothetical protein GGR26_003375 [Lewinella marina]|nr:hypothetical protein [Neolewinella marina]
MDIFALALILMLILATLFLIGYSIYRLVSGFSNPVH